MERSVKSPSLHFDATSPSYVLLIDMLINELLIFEAPWYNSTSRKLITAPPFIITTHFFPFEHRLLQVEPVYSIEEDPDEPANGS
jgi:hypothetical protein